MSEITKLYENAGVLKECLSPCYINKTWRKTHDCPNCDNRENYPPFTAEKQIELIKWLSTKELKIRTNKQPYAVYIGLLGDDNTCFFGCEGLYFEQTLAELVNFLWQDLTPKEKQQVKGILE